MNDIFKKCYEFTATKYIKEQGVYPYFKRVESAQGPEVVIDGRKVVVVCSNNYLGLADNPRVIEGSIKRQKNTGHLAQGPDF